jgi:two-component system NtrC family sensor kinase
METEKINTRVLVIDDEEIVRDNIEEILVPPVKHNEQVAKAASILFGEQVEKPLLQPRHRNMPNFVVEKAANGMEGLEKVKQSLATHAPYAVIFLDMRMPGWDGLETALHIREIDAKAEIIFVTAYSDTSIEDIVEKAGQNVGYHCKPYAAEEIMQLAAKAVSDYNKLRNLEQLIYAISSISLSENHLNSLLKNILDQIANYTQTDMALLGKLHKDGSYEKIFSIGPGEEKLNQLQLSSLIEKASLNSTEQIIQVDELVFAKMEDYIVFTALKKDKHLKTEKLYLLKLFVQSAARAIRTAGLQNKLIEKEKLSAVGNAMSMLMHDLRSPIKNIPVLTGIIRDDGIQHPMLDLLDKCGEQAAEIFDDFLDFIREVSIKPEKLLLHKLVEEGIAIAQSTKDCKSLHIQTDIPETLYILADKSKFKRIITNLVNNSAEILRDKGTIAPVIQITAIEKDGHISLTIRDNGPGIPANLLKTLFTPFVTQDKSGGTGLGLAIVKQFVLAHNGEISAHNDGGAVIHIILSSAK